jgi:hypothetical protein
MPISRAPRTLGTLLTAAGLLGGSVLAAVPAGAADDPMRLGDLTASVTSGSTPVLVPQTGSSAAYWDHWLGSLDTAEGQVCPSGHQSRSRLFGYVDGVAWSADIGSGIRATVDSAPDGIGGLLPTDTHVHRSGEFLDTTSNGLLPAVISTGGTIELRSTCQAATAYAPATDPYYAITVVMQPGGAWAVSDGPVVPKTDTTTTVAASGVTATAATLTATVAPAGATGTVTFTKDGAPIGSPATITGGTATVQVSGLSPATAYTFGATYSGDDAYATSTGSTTATTAAAAATATPSVAVQVPAVTATDPTGLTLSVASSAVTLTGPTARTQGEVWTATGALGEVTVKDDRRNASATGWTLNGKAAAFAVSGKSIAASNLGWAPEKVSGAGTAGAAVTAGQDGGLSTDRPLATGAASAAQDVVTVVKAGLTLKVPADAADGAYTSTLTLPLMGRGGGPGVRPPHPCACPRERRPEEPP